jgi:mycothiol synthase
MRLELRPLTLADVPAVHAMICDPSLATAYEALVPAGELEDEWKDPYFVPELSFLALADGEPAAWSLGMVIPNPPQTFAFVRIGVPERWRRRGIGSALLRRTLDGLEARAPGVTITEIAMGAWLPSGTAAPFAERHGFRHARYFWRMNRPRGAPVTAPEWPAGIEIRTLESDRMLGEWNEAYNASFAEHYHYVPSTLEGLRRRMETAEFRTSVVLLAYRDGECVGFCRNSFMGRRGEIALLGTVPSARGIGLGRALLRWGVEGIETRDCDTTELQVDGENENALGLYRSEGFTVTQTREIWVRSPGL